MRNIFERLSFHNWIKFFLVALVVVVLDQFSKFYVLQNLSHGEVIKVVPDHFNIVLAYNLGAAFGMLADLQDGTRQLVLMLTTVIALFVVFYFLLFEFSQNRVARLALAMIFGGAIGNIIDRARIGMVVDFLDFYVGANHWPAFNIADSSICIAVFILLFQKSGRAKGY